MEAELVNGVVGTRTVSKWEEEGGEMRGCGGGGVKHPCTVHVPNTRICVRNSGITYNLPFGCLAWGPVRVKLG